MTHIMKGDPDSTIVREFNGDEMKAVSKFVFFNEKLQFKIRSISTGVDCQQRRLHAQLQSRIRSDGLTETIPVIFNAKKKNTGLSICSMLFDFVESQLCFANVTSLQFFICSVLVCLIIQELFQQNTLSSFYLDCCNP